MSTDDAFFQIGTGLECVWGRWAGPGLVLGRSTGYASSGLGNECYCADRRALNVALLCKKNQKEEGGRRGAAPVAAPMPKSVSF